MNKQDIADVQSVIKNTMTEYLFEAINDTTIKNLTKDIATNINVKEFYDYMLLIELIDQGSNIHVNLAIKNTINKEFMYFHAQYNDCPDSLTATFTDDEIKQSKENMAYKSAMEIL